MANVDVRQPGIQVLLKKNVARKTVNGQTPVSKRWSAQESSIDITNWLAEGQPVRIRKSVREPAGAFSLSLFDKLDPQILDTIYAAIEPMDVIEIRFAANAYEYAGGKLPLQMRGFVSRVRRTQTMGADGKPRRVVTVTGQDYGKILQRYQIFFLPNVPLESQQLVNSLPFFTKFGSYPSTMLSADFVSKIVGDIVNPYLAKMQANSPNTSSVMQLMTDLQVSGGTVSLFGVGTFTQGTLLELLRRHCDVGAWNELFIEDREDAPYLVYRPNPAADILTGDWLMRDVASDSATLPLSVEIDQTDVVTYDVGRSDENVANIFWVDAPRFVVNYENTWKMLSFQANSDPNAPVDASSYGNVDPSLYGWSKMQENTAQGGSLETDNGNGSQDGDARNQNQQNALDWMISRRRLLYQQNKDNVLFEDGSMRLKGNEQIRAGKFVALTHGSLRSLHYAEAVDHEVIPFGNYFTAIQFVRGTGFSDRIQQSDSMQSPYYSEMIQDPPSTGINLQSQVSY